MVHPFHRRSFLPQLKGKGSTPRAPCYGSSAYGPSSSYCITISLGVTTRVRPVKVSGTVVLMVIALDDGPFGPGRWDKVAHHHAQQGIFLLYSTHAGQASLTT